MDGRVGPKYLALEEEWMEHNKEGVGGRWVAAGNPNRMYRRLVFFIRKVYDYR